MKRLLSFLLVTLLVVAAIPASLFSAFAAEQTSVSVSAPTEIVYTGDRKNDTFAVSASLTLAPDIAGIAGYEIILKWDAQLLALSDTPSVKSPGIYTVNLDNAASGIAKFVVANATDEIGNGVLFEAHFYPLTDKADATISVEAEKMSTASGFIPCDGGETVVTLIPLPPVVVNVDTYPVLTDGVLNYAEDWGSGSTNSVILIKNDNCTRTDMDVELIYPIGKTIFIDRVTLYFYHCPEVMIGYPEGNATVLVSTDGEHYTPVGVFTFADANLVVGKFGTVKNAFEFPVSEAAYIKVCFSVGDSTDVLGGSPAGGKIFWEYVGLTEMTYSRFCEHNYTVSATVEATCTTPGLKTYTCTECDDIYTETVEAFGHTESDWIVSQPATCESYGFRHRECTVCKAELKRETINALGHTIGDWTVLTEPTCSFPGKRAKLCETCGKSFEEETLPQTNVHTPADPVITKQPTCTSSGYQNINCAYCKFPIVYNQKIPAKGHTYDGGTVTTKPTCESTGTVLYKCIDCDNSYTAELAKGEHTAGELLIQEPTCTEAGYKKQSCSVCQKVLINETIPALNHNYDSVITTPPACEKAGLMTYTCTACGDNYTQSIAAVGHTDGEWTAVKQPTCTESGRNEQCCSVCEEVLRWETVPAHGHAADEPILNDATCTESGSETVFCLHCGTTLSATEIPAKGHSYGDGSFTEHATCEHDGSMLYTCETCRHTYEEVIPRLPHKEGEWEIITEATEEQQGEQIKKCTVCEEVLERKIIPVLTHEHKYDEGTVKLEPTCVTDGILQYTCDCGDYYTVSISAKGHTEGEILTKEATCSEEGYEKYFCGTCSELLTQTTFPKISHSYDEGVVTLEATCTEEGVKTYTCSACSDSYTEIISANGHQIGDWEIITEATCTQTGSKAKKCAVCGYVHASESIAKLDHTEGAPVLVTEPTCTSAGSQTVSCKTCGTLLRTIVVAATGHTEGEWITTVIATCSENGKKELLCNNCRVILQTQVVPMLAHSYGEGTEEQQPTCEENGVLKYTCTACAHTYTEKIPALGHKESEWLTVQEPSCTQNGLREKSCTVCGDILLGESTPALGHTEGEWHTVQTESCTQNGIREKRCSVCGELVASENIPALGHLAGNEEIGKQATCTESGTVVIKCIHCGETLSAEELPALGHTAGDWELQTPANCTVVGENVKKCTVCGEVLERQTIEPTGHDYDDGTVTLQPSCEAEGAKTFVCRNCEDSYQKPIAAIGHTAGDWEHINDATCTENGSNVKKCTTCGQVLETELLPADGHNASDWTIAEEATADKNGLKAKTCTVCGETLATALTPKHTAILPNENGKPENITDRWGKGNATEENITLITNPSDLLGMDIVLFQTFEELRKIDGISLSLYHSAGDGIGYPDSTATVLISTDGVNYSPIGTFTLQTAKISLDQAGTVTSTLTFETEAEALSVKILLHAGESTDLVGPAPDGGESYWKHIGIVSLDVSQVSDVKWVKGDVDGDGSFNTIDYMKLKRYILGTFELDETACKRADIDLDGNVAALDYMMLKRIYLGTHSFPA